MERLMQCCTHLKAGLQRGFGEGWDVWRLQGCWRQMLRPWRVGPLLPSLGTLPTGLTVPNPFIPFALVVKCT